MENRKSVKALDPEWLESGFQDMLPAFESTRDIEPLKGMIGQKRAVKAVSFGLEMKRTGYNMFLSGPPGTGKITYVKDAVGEKAKKESPPSDWIYVHNFSTPDQPLAIKLPAGEGRQLSKDMNTLIEEVQEAIRKAFSSEEYERQRGEVFKEMKDKQQEILSQLDELAKKKGFVVQRKSTGIVTIPAREGKPMKQEDFDKLPSEEKKEIAKTSHEVQKEVSESMRKVKKVERDMKEALDELDKVIGHFAIDETIDELKSRYQGREEIEEYLERVKEDIIENINDFKEQDEESTPFPFLSRREEDPRERYRVNLFIDHHGLQGAPVIFETNPTYANLTGKVEYQNRMGTMVTNYTMIKPGSLHQANGGYLIIQVRDLLSHYQAWEALKRALKNGKIVIENIGESLGVLSVSTLKPHPIPLDVKIILIGNPLYYQILYGYDEDFPKLFKIKGDFDTEMHADADTLEKLTSFISTHCHQEDIHHFSRQGVVALAEYCSRLAGHKKRFSTRFNELVELIYEAEARARINGQDLVEPWHVQEAIEEKIYRSNRFEEKTLRMFEEGTLLLDVEGEIVGQINGLSVLNLGDYQFGRPSKITAATYLGKAGVIHIEREVKMSGQIHSKGLLTLTGYLGSTFAQNTPLSLAASITFEQNYQGVDGDSASAAELLALLSSLAQVPLKQNLAITGSVNQKGEIQPVGGIPEKVEGFYKVCVMKGHKENIGVLIPHQNLENLVLSSEVKTAVREGRFHIYPIKTIDEAIEIMTELQAGEKEAPGIYPKGTFHYKVYNRLKEMDTLIKDKDEESPDEDD